MRNQGPRLQPRDLRSVRPRCLDASHRTPASARTYSKIEIQHRPQRIHLPVRTLARVVLMFVITFKLHMLSHGKNRTYIERHSAELVVVAVVVRFHACVWSEVNVPSRKGPLQRQAVPVSPRELALDES